MSYIASNQEPQTSTTHRGTLFEQRSLSLLQTHLSMSLHRVGGKSDGGIDLTGWWWLPESIFSAGSRGAREVDFKDKDGGLTDDGDDAHKTRRRIRVIAQCKAEKQKIGPKYLRELEGVVYGLLNSPHPQPQPSFQNTQNTQTQLSNADMHLPVISPPLVALFISLSPFTKSAVLRAQSSILPFFLLHIPHAQGNDILASADFLDMPPYNSNCNKATDHDELGTAIWNSALGGSNGLLRGQVEIRWERCAHSLPDSLHAAGRPGLWYRGHRLTSWVPDYTAPS